MDFIIFSKIFLNNEGDFKIEAFLNEILKNICKTKSNKIKNKGFSLGYEIPRKRLYPLNKIKKDSPIIISEIKRKSPTEGDIALDINIIECAKNYISNGCNAISVLCEEDYFGGSIKDLMEVKANFKDSTLLRKDFILYKEEIEISYLIGADIVLLIAAIFIENEIKFIEILKECKKFNLDVLIEIHNEEELDFVLKIRKKIKEKFAKENFEIDLIGINSRNLKTFEINKLNALMLRNKIPSPIKVVFESGISCTFDAYLIGACGFDGILCGTFLLKSQKETLPKLIQSFMNGRKDRFYKSFFNSIAKNKPIIKICGITNIFDAKLCIENGVEILGFILCESRRKISVLELESICKKLEKYNVLKVAVVLENEFQIGKELLERGVIDALQLHDFKNDVYANYDLRDANFAFFGAKIIHEKKDLQTKTILPFLLFDAPKNEKKETLDSILLDIKTPLFIGGGINICNINFFKHLNLFMIDICSGVEKDGDIKKDENKLKALIHALRGMK